MAAGFNKGGVKDAIRLPAEESPAPASEETLDNEFDALNAEFDSGSRIPRTEDFADDEGEAEHESEIPSSDPSASVADAPDDDADATDGDEVGDEDDASQLAALAEAYGFDPERLSHFSSYKEAEKALSFLDAQLYAEGQASLTDYYQGGQQPPTPWQQPPQQPPAPQQAEPASQQQLAALKLELEEWGADDPAAKNFTAIQQYTQGLQQKVAQMEQYLVSMHQQQLQQETQRRLSDFHNTVDRMNSPLFGKAEKMTPLQRQTRQQLAAHIDAMEYGLRGRGMQVPGIDQLVERTVKFAFADQLTKEQLRNQPRNGKPGSKPKFGKPGRGRSRKDSNRPEDWDGDFEDNPALHRLYAQMAEESGAA